MNKLRNKDNRVALGVFEKLSYASGGVGTCMCFMAIGGYLLYVYTDIFHMNAVTAANIFLFTRFWDAVNDPMMGAVVDLRIFAKKGRGVYRPWILIGLPFLLVFFALCFTLPSFITSETGKVIWCVAFYVLYTMAQTVVQVPYGAVTNAITTDTEERGLLGSYRNFGENIASFLVSLVMMSLVSFFASKGGNGYAGAAWVLAIAAAVCLFICWKNTKERAVVEESEEETAKADSSNNSNASESKKDNTASNTNTSSNKNNTSSSKPSNSGSNNSGSSKPSNNSGSNSSNSKPAEHTHNWVAQYKTVNVPEKGHNEQVLVQAAYDEQVPQYQDLERSICNQCGADITNNIDAHFKSSWDCSGYHMEFQQVLTGYKTVHHEAVYETRYVVDSPATTKQELAGYKCSSCGKTKAN